MSIINGLKGALEGARDSRSRRAASPQLGARSSKPYCLRCGHQGRTQTVTPGSILIEIILWLCFIVPGLIYSIWRHNRRHQACAKCGSADVIPGDSPTAIRAQQAL